MTPPAARDLVLGVSPWLLLLFAAIALGGLVTLLKGRLLWFLAGFLFGGLIWPLTAWIPATPDSVWAARFHASRERGA